MAIPRRRSSAFACFSSHLTRPLALDSALFVWKECIPTMLMELKDVGWCVFFSCHHICWPCFLIGSCIIFGEYMQLKVLLTIPNFISLHSTGQCGHRRLLGRFRKHLCRDEGTQKAGLHRWRHPRLRRRSCDGWDLSRSGDGLPAYRIEDVVFLFAQYLSNECEYGLIASYTYYILVL